MKKMGGEEENILKEDRSWDGRCKPGIPGRD
jgi:hypothetical protein